MSFLKTTGLTPHVSISRAIMILSGLGMFLGFKVLNSNHEALFFVFMFSGMSFGMVGFWYELLMICCPSCDASLTWHAYSKLPLGESESWLRRFEECPYCHFRPGVHAATPSTEIAPPWSRATPELSDLETGAAAPVQGRAPHGPQSSRWRKFLWPKIDGLVAAEDAKRSGYGLAVYMAILIVLSPAVGPDHYSPLALILAGFWGALAWGIRRASRVAACAGLGLSLGSLLLAWPPTPTVDTPTWSKALWALIFSWWFANGIRGAFAVHKYRVDAGVDGSASTA